MVWADWPVCNFFRTSTLSQALYLALDFRTSERGLLTPSVQWKPRLKEAKWAVQGHVVRRKVEFEHTFVWLWSLHSVLIQGQDAFRDLMWQNPEFWGLRWDFFALVFPRQQPKEEGWRLERNLKEVWGVLRPHSLLNTIHTSGYF